MTGHGLLPLRDYQEESLDAVTSDWLDAALRRLAVVLPTGAGKTVVFAHKAARWRAEHRSRVMILVHRDELADQTIEKLHAIAPHLTVGLIKGPTHEVNRDVIVASVQSLRSEARRNRVYDIGLIIVDECHHATANTYRAVLTHFGCFEPDGALAVGYTATLSRSDEASLGDIWQKVSYVRDILFMIRRRYLLDVYGKRVDVPELNLDKVKRTGGDYQDGDLGAAMMEAWAPEIAATAYVEHARADGPGSSNGYRSGVLFAPTVESAIAFADAFNDVGIKTEHVNGMTPRDERKSIFGRARDGTTTMVTNCGVATEGTDVPRWSCAVIARPTSAAGLYQQMAGRVLRPFEGQGPGQPIEKALLLDVAGVTRKHQLRSLVDLTGRTYREPVEADQSLLEHDEYELALDVELAERNALQGQGLEWDYRTGANEIVTVDLFEDSRQQWLRTEGGTWFLPADKSHYVFLVPWRRDKVPCAPGNLSVCWAHRYQRTGGFTEHEDIEESYARAWGEDVATTYGTGYIMDKKARWRNNRPSPKMQGMATGLGLTFDEFVTGGELSNMITVREGTRRIDSIVERMGRGKNG